MRRRTHIPRALFVRKISRDKICGPWVRGLGLGAWSLALGPWVWGLDFGLKLEKMVHSTGFEPVTSALGSIQVYKYN